MTEMGFTQTATIPKTAERCRAEGIGLSEDQLRRLVKAGRLRSIPMGRNSLIYWPNLIAFLESGGDQESGKHDGGAGTAASPPILRIEE